MDAKEARAKTKEAIEILTVNHIGILRKRIEGAITEGISKGYFQASIDVNDLILDANCTAQVLAELEREGFEVTGQYGIGFTIRW